MLSPEVLPAQTLAVATTGSAFFNLTGRERYNDGKPFVVNVDAITGGEDVDVLLESGVQDTPSGGSPQALHVTVQDVNTFAFNGLTGDYLAHFYPDPRQLPSPSLDPTVFAAGNGKPVNTTYLFKSASPNRRAGTRAVVIPCLDPSGPVSKDPGQDDLDSLPVAAFFVHPGVRSQDQI